MLVFYVEYYLFVYMNWNRFRGVLEKSRSCFFIQICLYWWNLQMILTSHCNRWYKRRDFLIWFYFLDFLKFGLNVVLMFYFRRIFLILSVEWVFMAFLFLTCCSLGVLLVYVLPDPIQLATRVLIADWICFNLNILNKMRNLPLNAPSLRKEKVKPNSQTLWNI